MAKPRQITSKSSKRAQAVSPEASLANVLTTTARAPATLHIKLLSDATFSRGEGTAGVVDTEVEHDEFGVPFIGGKTVRGLLRDAWLSMSKYFPELDDAAERVLGRSQVLDDSCRLRVTDAILPDDLRGIVCAAVARTEKPLAPSAVLDAFTSIRFQTSEDRSTGAPRATTLRSSRVVLNGFTFVSRLHWLDGYEPQADDVRLLALCALCSRHGGLLRNRGRGHLRMTLNGDSDSDLMRTRSYLELNS